PRLPVPAARPARRRALGRRPAGSADAARAPLRLPALAPSRARPLDLPAPEPPVRGRLPVALPVVPHAGPGPGGDRCPGLAPSGRGRDLARALRGSRDHPRPRPRLPARGAGPKDDGTPPPRPRLAAPFWPPAGSPGPPGNLVDKVKDIFDTGQHG